MRRSLTLPLCIVLATSGIVGVALAGCGSGRTGQTSSTVTSTTVGATSGPGVPDASVTTSPSGPGPLTSGASGEGTTVFTGTTLPAAPGQPRALTFVGLASTTTWRAIRQILIEAGGDGEKVLAAMPGLAQGPPVEVADVEIDAVRGVGYAAGADTSQALAVAIGDDGAEVMVLAFIVTGNPAQTTVAGFERHTYHVVLVEGPLPISDSTGNITTVPGY